MTLRSDQGPRPAYCTIRIMPEAFNPEKTVILPPGSVGARVAMEGGTNLKDWSEATNGVYADPDIAKFFRIKLDRAGFVPPIPQAGSVASESGAQTTTLFVGQSASETAELTIGEYQTAEIVAAGNRGAHLELTVGSMTYRLTGTDNLPDYTTGRSWKNWSPVRGPAKFKLIGATEHGYCTIRVAAEMYPADKTLVVLPGTNTYEVALEGSTNLAHWVTATNGYYTNQNAAMFFRIRSTRLP